MATGLFIMNSASSNSKDDAIESLNSMAREIILRNNYDNTSMSSLTDSCCFTEFTNSTDELGLGTTTKLLDQEITNLVDDWVRNKKSNYLVSKSRNMDSGQRFFGSQYERRRVVTTNSLCRNRLFEEDENENEIKIQNCHSPRMPMRRISSHLSISSSQEGTTTGSFHDDKKSKKATHRSKSPVGARIESLPRRWNSVKVIGTTKKCSKLGMSSRDIVKAGFEHGRRVLRNPSFERLFRKKTENVAPRKPLRYREHPIIDNQDSNTII